VEARAVVERIMAAVDGRQDRVRRLGEARDRLASRAALNLRLVERYWA